MVDPRSSTSETLVDGMGKDKGEGLHHLSAANAGAGQMQAAPLRAAMQRSPSKKMGTPTALGFLSFAICLSIMSFALVGLGVTSLTTLWADLGVFLFGGGGMMALTAVLEILRGDSLAFAFFGAFATYWFGLAALYRADYGILNTAAKQMAAGQPGSQQLNQALGLWQMTYTMLCLIFAVAAIRTNIVFCSICTFLIPFFLCLSILFTGSLSISASQNMATAAGSFGFIVCMLSWYTVASLLLSHGAAPLRLPLGNMKSLWAKKEQPHRSV